MKCAAVLIRILLTSNTVSAVFCSPGQWVCTEPFTIDDPKRSNQTVLLSAKPGGQPGRTPCKVKLGENLLREDIENGIAFAVLLHEDCELVLGRALTKLSKTKAPSLGEIFRLGLPTFSRSKEALTPLRKRRIDVAQCCLGGEKILEMFTPHGDPDLEKSDTSISSTELYNHLFNLPPELRTIIVHYCWPSPFLSYAIVLGEAHSLILRMRFFRTVKKQLSQPLCLTWPITPFFGTATFPNRHYLSYISNNRLAASDVSHQLEFPVYKIRTNADHLGILNVEFIGKKKSLKFESLRPVAGEIFWYRILEPANHGIIEKVQKQGNQAVCKP